jgi:hypothetical protein
LNVDEPAGAGDSFVRLRKRWVRKTHEHNQRELIHDRRAAYRHCAPVKLALKASTIRVVTSDNHSRLVVSISSLANGDAQKIVAIWNARQAGERCSSTRQWRAPGDSPIRVRPVLGSVDVRTT